MSDQAIFILQALPNLLVGFPGQRPGGLLLTIGLTIIAITAGWVVAISLGTLYQSPHFPIRAVAHGYVYIFRGLPLILLVLLTHQLLGIGRQWGITTTPLRSALIALTLYSGAYQAEIVRAGLDAVPLRLIESARLIGSTRWQAYRLIQLRYALRVMRPAFTGQAISLFKDTSVVIIIGVAELMTVARISLGSDVGNAPYWVGLYLVVGFLYWCVAFALSRVTQHWEQQQKMTDLTHSMANY